MKNKVFIVDDHPFTRAGVRSILEANSTIDIIGEAVDGLDAVKQVIEKRPDLVVMDINMPQLSGIDATREILNKLPDIKIIALSIHKGEIFVKKMLAAGAVGYLLKDEAPEELLIAILSVIKGDIYLSPAITRAALSASVPSEKLFKVSILQSKLQRPPITFDSVVRTKIIHELESNIAKPLSLVSAGAGYGKSATVSQWLEQTDYLYSWISIDEEHNDFLTFLHYIIAAVDKIFPGLLEKTKELCLSSMLPSDKELSDVLMNELFNIDQDFVLVFDDFHLISEKRIFDLLDGWLRFPPQNIHLCLISRRDPPLNLNVLRVSGRMTELRMDKLTFSDEEIAELFNQTKHLVLDNQDIDLLKSITEGWAISLKLISILINSQEELNRLLASSERGLHTVYDYLLTEVLSKQSDQIRWQLFVTSFLDRFCEDLIWELTKSKDDEHIKNLIPRLLKSNLFTIPLDLEGKWFRFHHLFQDFLQSELQKNINQEEIKEIHTKASLWFESNDFIEESIDHAMKSCDTNRAVEIISKKWEDVSDSDNFLTVDKWLSYLPEHVIQSSINLLFARFYSIFKGHKLTELPLVLELILESNTSLNDAEKGYLAFINSFLHYYSGEGEKSLAEAEKAIKLIPKKHVGFIGDARTFWFLSMLMIGKKDEALAAHKMNINKFLELDEPVQLGRTRTNMSFSALFNADLPLLRKATEEMSKTPDLSNFMRGFYRLNLQYIAWFSGNMQGVVMLSEGVINVRHEFTGRLVIDCYVMKALALEELNKSDLATNTMKDAIEFAEYTKDPSNLVVALSGRARLKLIQGKIEFAADWLEKTELSDIAVTMLWCIEVPEITKCRVLIARGRKKDLATALDLLIKYRKFSQSVYFKIQTIDIMMLQVRAYKKLMQENKAHDTLKAAIEIAAEGEWIRPFAEQKGEISDLLLNLKEEGTYPDFIDMIFEPIEKSVKLIAKVSEALESITKYKIKGSLYILTKREFEVLKCVAEGLRNREIADRLFNSEETIKKHIYHMFQKLEVKNRLSLVSKAKKLGILA